MKNMEIKVLDHGYVRYVDHMGTDMRVVEAARISYKSATKGEEADKKLLKYLYTNRHTSPFEMLKVTLNVKLPIFVMRQWVRHRMQNLNEVSARYTQLPAEFYIPTKWRAQDTKNKQGSVATEENWNPKVDVGDSFLPATEALELWSHQTYQKYQNLLNTGIAREMARIVLPVNIYTEIYCCWDMKNLLHFFSLRDDSHAQAEIQEYAKAMKLICNELFPWTMEVYEESRKL